MKKVFFLFVALVAAVCTMTTLTSCEPEQINTARTSVKSKISYVGEVSSETLNEITVAEIRINAQLVKMFGEEFIVECKSGTWPTEDDFLPYDARISDDSVIKKEIEHLKTLKTTDGSKTVTTVNFNYVNGTTVFTTFKIIL